MSVVWEVYFLPARLPTIAEWQAAIDAAGFPLRLDDDGRALTASTGYFPVERAGQASGFELFCEIAPAEEVPATVAVKLPGVLMRASFVTHSEIAELITKLYAAAALAKITDGTQFDTESGELVAPPDPLQHARDQVAEIERDELQVDANARLLERLGAKPLAGPQPERKRDRTDRLAAVVAATILIALLLVSLWLLNHWREIVGR
jgi:hypothetical protein